MEGDDRIRYCFLCHLNVYNISEMTSQEVVDLIMEKEGKLCVQLYRRTDGTVLTQDCKDGKLRPSAALNAMGQAIFAEVGGIEFSEDDMRKVEKERQEAEDAKLKRIEEKRKELYDRIAAKEKQREDQQKE